MREAPCTASTRMCSTVRGCRRDEQRDVSTSTCERKLEDRLIAPEMEVLPSDFLPTTESQYLLAKPAFIPCPNRP